MRYFPNCMAIYWVLEEGNVIYAGANKEFGT
jgi:hypothetical protein